MSGGLFGGLCPAILYVPGSLKYWFILPSERKKGRSGVRILAMGADRNHWDGSKHLSQKFQLEQDSPSLALKFVCPK